MKKQVVTHIISNTYSVFNSYFSIYFSVRSFLLLASQLNID